MNEPFEKQLIGKRVQFRSFDWQRTLNGTLQSVEKYLYIVRLDNSGLLGIQKHSVGAIAPIKGEE